MNTNSENESDESLHFPDETDRVVNHFEGAIGLASLSVGLAAWRIVYGTRRRDELRFK
jgi:hypothetical protein